MGHAPPDVAIGARPSSPGGIGGPAPQKGVIAASGGRQVVRHLFSLLLFVALLVPVVAVARVSFRDDGAAPLEERYHDVVPAGTVRCRYGVYVPSPSGRSFSCPFGGEFRCGVNWCELYRGEHAPEERWILVRDGRTGRGTIGRGEIRKLDGEVWYGSVPVEKRRKRGS